jgi:hypothetical protein
MDNLSPNSRPLIFPGSLLATLFGLVLIIDPERLTGLLGWDDLSYIGVYLRGLFFVCCGCWFGLRSWRAIRVAAGDDTEPPPPPKAPEAE